MRPKPEGGYEMVAGHRRKKAADLAGLAEIPCIVRQLTDDEATIIMVDSNLQREQILPSEKAFAYKMKLDALKRQGQRTDLTSDPLGQKLKGVYSVEMVAHETPDSKTQVQRYIRLTHLIPEICQNKTGQINGTGFHLRIPACNTGQSDWEVYFQKQMPVH